MHVGSDYDLVVVVRGDRRKEARTFAGKGNKGVDAIVMGEVGFFVLPLLFVLNVRSNIAFFDMHIQGSISGVGEN